MALFICLLVTGCAGVSQLLPPPGQGWTTHLGQLAYSSKKRDFMGDIVMQVSPDGGIKLDFMKGPGPSLVSIRQTTERARVEGALMPIAWQGAPASAPALLSGWLTIQPTLQALQSGKPLPKGVKANLGKSSSGAWKQLEISIPARQERFLFIFQS